MKGFRYLIFATALGIGIVLQTRTTRYHRHPPRMSEPAVWLEDEIAGAFGDERCRPLEARVGSLQFVDARFSDVLDALHAKTGVRLDVRWTALSRDDVQANDRCTVTILDERLGDALQAVFKSMAADSRLMCYPEHGAVVVTTIFDFRARVVMRVYPVGDLLDALAALDRAQPKPPPVAWVFSDPNLQTPLDTAQCLMQWIERRVDPDAWPEYGGADATWSCSGRALSIIATPRDHAAIERCLRDIRRQPIKAVFDACRR